MNIFWSANARARDEYCSSVTTRGFDGFAYNLKSRTVWVNQSDLGMQTKHFTIRAVIASSYVASGHRFAFWIDRLTECRLRM